MSPPTSSIESQPHPPTHTQPSMHQNIDSTALPLTHHYCYPSLCLTCHLSIVGDDDNGQLFTDREYANYQQTVADARLNHRLYCSWRNTTLALDCRQIGPSSQCFCTHRYRQHATDNWQTREVHCKVSGCECRLFEYLPIRGSQEARCHCKHAHDQHNARTKRCRHSTLQSSAQKAITNGGSEEKSSVAASSSSTALQRGSVSSTNSTAASKRPINSTSTLVPRNTRPPRPTSSSSSSSSSSASGSGCQCDRFSNSNSCSCGSQWSQHSTVFESREEREAAGRPVDRYGGTMYQAMGGVTGFTSLVDGVDKLSLDEERNIRRQPLAAGSDGRVRLAQPTLDDGSSSDRRGGVSAVVGGSSTAAEQLVSGDDRKQRELRRGKMGEVDEMALYEQKYKKAMSVRSRTGLRPITPQRVEDDSTRSGSGTPRRSSFNTSMAVASSAAGRSAAASSSSSSSSSAVSTARRPLSGRSSATASPSDSAASSGSSTPRRSSTVARKPAVPVQSVRRGSGTQPAADKR